MFKPSIIAIGAVLIATPSAMAATEADCLALWKTADVNSDGALTKTEDSKKLIAAAQQKGRQLKQADTLSRDEFVQYCKGGDFDTMMTQAPAPAQTPGPAASQDLGKGNLTPSTKALSEKDARSKLEASGFKDLKGLRLDDKGIWHANADLGGKRQDVAIDAQSDITTTGAPQPATKKPAPTAAAAPMSRGNSGPGALLLWTFLLIGNALALFGLSSATAGGTSAMSSRQENPFV